MLQNKPFILIVDDDENLLNVIRECMGEEMNLHFARNSEEAFQILKDNNIDIILLDIDLIHENGLDLIAPMKESNPFCEIIMLTASNEVYDAVKAMKKGAFDYITKPFEREQLEAAIQKAEDKIQVERKISQLEENIERLQKFENLIFASPEMQIVVDTIRKIAPLDSTILIKGESGTGKELAASAIHNQSKRCSAPFVAVNCASIPENLFEAEMFGFEKGSFTGAVQTKVGKMEIANEGTIFLDEVSSLGPGGQASLLRAIEHKEIERVGSVRKIPLDIRIIAATNHDLKEMVHNGDFREDLYFRLNVIPLEIPPLRSRKDDITVLVKHFIKKYNYILNKKIPGLSKEALKILLRYQWPGNVRELENLLERLMSLGRDKAEIGVDALPMEIVMSDNQMLEEEKVLSLEESKKQFERELIIAALERADWNRKSASRILGVHVNTLLNKMRSMAITPPAGS